MTTSPFGSQPHERDALYFDIDPAEVDELLVALRDVRGDLSELREAFRDIRILVLDGLGENYQREHLREIAKVMTRPPIARFTRGA